MSQLKGILNIENIGIILFLVILLVLLYKNRKKIIMQNLVHVGKLPIIYISMIKTKLGIRLMDNLSKKFSKPLKYIGYLAIIVGFIGMIVISYSLLENIYNIITKPSTAPGVGIVLPIEAKGVFYVPFFYWVISIFIIALIHEFSHGIFIRLYDVKVKSSGFAILGLVIPIIPAAFVEPNEKRLVKKSPIEQLSVYSAGPFSNILLGLVILALSLFVLSPVLASVLEFDGVFITDIAKSNSTQYPAEKSGMKSGEIIKYIDEAEILTINNFTGALGVKKPNEIIKITTNNTTYIVKLAESPYEDGKSYLGVSVVQSKSINPVFKERFGNVIPGFLLWIVGLLYWLSVLNLGIGLFNLVPIGPTDGGRMIKCVLDRYFKKENANTLFNSIGIFFLVIIIVIILVSFVR